MPETIYLQESYVDWLIGMVALVLAGTLFLRTALELKDEQERQRRQRTRQKR